ncbi:MAG: carbohydrate kinase family protein [Chloroflexi bacterium]|nr:carbohydrate kinase family protein [Chloroflexota bacterium]
MKSLDLFSIGAWAPFDHIYKLATYPSNGDTVTMDMPIEGLDTVYYGDCSVNIAAAAARLGLRVGLGMVVGDDFRTSGYEAHLLRLGVDTSGVEIVPGARSGHNYLYFDASGDGFCISHRGIAADQSSWGIPEAEVASARAVVVSEAFTEYTLKAIRWARASGALTAINGMIGTAGEKAAAFLEVADILFIADSELRNLLMLLGFTRVEELHTLGPRRIFATRGAQGSRVYSEDGIHEIDAIPTERFADPTGAGDSYTAGTLAALLRGDSDSDAARVGAAVSSIVVEAWGCQTNLPDWDTIEQRLNRGYRS